MIGHGLGHLGGPIALVEDGDTITGMDNAEINLRRDEELAARQAKWQALEVYTQRGTLAKYAQLVSSAASAVTVSGLIVAEDARAPCAARHKTCGSYPFIE